ncbi:unnamed protein product [Mytilus edulis]|uniref:Macro domain-containing protein n=1 Tax=Mytilus edulis TaxID=6550 RepID=A0A8S3VPK0_MYTED|nr:unnamed protein product [Mytilus edulis]
MQNCLLKANTSAYKSIAFPALGTGNLKYPMSEVARMMFANVKKFERGNPISSITDVFQHEQQKEKIDLKTATVTNVPGDIVKICVNAMVKLRKGLKSKAHKHKHDTSETEDVLLAGIEDRSNKMMVLQQQVLERLRPVSSDRERDAFVDWIRTVITELDHVVWRRCQQDISNTLYRYIAENDQTKRAQSIPTPVIQPQLRQQMQPLQAQSSSYSAPWQPPPSQWHAQPSSNVSVWQSQDANWVSQQFPQPRQNMSQLQPIRSSSAGPSVPVSGWDGITNRSMTASPSPTRQADTSRTSQSSFHLSDLINISDPDPENV